MAVPRCPLLVLLAVLAVLAACLPGVVVGQAGTVKPADTDAVEVVTKPPAGAPVTGAGAKAPAATPYEPAPIPEATEDSPTFRKAPNANCSDEVAELIESIYMKNRALFDACARASKYQIFPFSGKLPTPTQIFALASDKACTALFTACVLADLPQCDIGELGLKAVVETLLKVTVDIDNGKPTPDTMRFHNLHMWRRDSNRAQAAGVPFGNDSQLYREYTTNLWTALTSYNVHVLPDLRIEYNETEIAGAMNGLAQQTLSDASGSTNGAFSAAMDAALSPVANQNGATPSAATAAAAPTAHRRVSAAVVCIAIASAAVVLVGASL